jgi:hypothetical protein
VVRSKVRPRGLSSHPYDLGKKGVMDGSSFSGVQKRLSSIQTAGSCHCDCDHSEVESDGGKASFLTDRSVELGSPFEEGGPVIKKIKLDRRLMPSSSRR